MFKRTFALSAIAAAMFSMPALAQEQDQQAYAQQQMEEMANQPITDEQLEQFADALGEIERINDEFVAQLEEADSQEEAQELQIAAQSEMVECLSVEEYNAIAYRMQNDPEIQQRIEELRS